MPTGLLLEPVLYSFRRCPYAMRARMALLASGTRTQLREVVLRDKPAALLGASPKGTVPVLILADGTVLDQSLNIMLHVLREHDPLHWLPATPDEMHIALQLIDRCDAEFKHALDRYKYPHRYALPNGDFHRAQGATFLSRLDIQLKAQGFLHGPHWGLADAAIAPFVRQFAHTDPDWFATQAWPALQAWLHAFEASSVFLMCMHKALPWQEGDGVRFFPPD